MKTRRSMDDPVQLFAAFLLIVAGIAAVFLEPKGGNPHGLHQALAGGMISLGVILLRPDVFRQWAHVLLHVIPWTDPDHPSDEEENHDDP